MKKLILVTATFVLALSATAQENSTSTPFHEKAAQLLQKNSGRIKLEGDVHKGERIASILNRMRAQSETSSVYCEMFPRAIAARCMVVIAHRPMGETALTYYVSLDNNKMPETIMENRVSVSRGD